MEFEDNITYYTYRGKRCEINFEACFNGCDVAVYDNDLNLLEPKFCTNLTGFGPGEQREVLDNLKMRAIAFKKAQEFFERYELKIIK